MVNTHFPLPRYLWYECTATSHPIKAECWLCAAPLFIISLTGAAGSRVAVAAAAVAASSPFPPDLLSGGQPSLALREMPLDFIFQIYYPRAARQFNLQRPAFRGRIEPTPCSSKCGSRLLISSLAGSFLRPAGSWTHCTILQPETINTASGR